MNVGKEETFPAVRKLLKDVVTFLRYRDDGDVTAGTLEGDVRSAQLEIDCFPNNPVDVKRVALDKLTDVERKVLGL